MEVLKTKPRRKNKNPIPYSMRKNPYLNHPKLSEGQKKFLGSICTVYSTENMKRGIEEQYVRQLIVEKEKGSISDDDFFKYLDYFCQSSKRKHLFTAPKNVRSDRKRNSIDQNKPLPPSSNYSNKKGSLNSSTTDSRSSRASSSKEKFEQNPVDAEITVIGETTSESCVSSNNLSDEEQEIIPEIVSEEKPTTAEERDSNCQEEEEEVVPKTPVAETASIAEEIEDGGDEEVAEDAGQDESEINVKDENEEDVNTKENDDPKIDEDDSVFEAEKTVKENAENKSLGEPTTNLLNLLESPTTKTSQE